MRQSQLSGVLATAQKLFRRLTNYTKHQKTFVLFLFVLTASLLLFPILTVTPTTDLSMNSYSLWIRSPAYFKSFLVIALAVFFLLGRNMHVGFKRFVVRSFGFRETEPVLNFIFLWMIVATYMGILDSVGFVGKYVGAISISRGLWTQLLILVVGLVMGLLDVRKSANLNSQKTKILNIVDEEAPQRPENKRVVQHLFEDEDLD